MSVGGLLFQTSEESKKRKRAKTLVEKAKVIQQSRKASVKEQEATRRSSRSEANIKRSYCEDEVQAKIDLVPRSAVGISWISKCCWKALVRNPIFLFQLLSSGLCDLPRGPDDATEDQTPEISPQSERCSWEVVHCR